MGAAVPVAGVSGVLFCCCCPFVLHCGNCLLVPVALCLLPFVCAGRVVNARRVATRSPHTQRADERVPWPQLLSIVVGMGEEHLLFLLLLLGQVNHASATRAAYSTMCCSEHTGAMTVARLPLAPLVGCPTGCPTTSRLCPSHYRQRQRNTSVHHLLVYILRLYTYAKRLAGSHQRHAPPMLYKPPVIHTHTTTTSHRSLDRPAPPTRKR